MFWDIFYVIAGVGVTCETPHVLAPWAFKRSRV